MGNKGLERAFGRDVAPGSSLPDPVGDAPGCVRVSKGGEKFSYGSSSGPVPSDRGGKGGSGQRPTDNLGDPPGIVRK